MIMTVINVAISLERPDAWELADSLEYKFRRFSDGAGTDFRVRDVVFITRKSNGIKLKKQIQKFLGRKRKIKVTTYDESDT